MRHGKRFNHLGRTASHRAALLSNMASSLIIEKRISTTVAKAKALRKYVEPLLTKSKLDTTHSRRIVFSYLQNKESVQVLFDEVAEKIATRPGGYTRILKTGSRLGDNAEMCVIELVDYNEAMLKEEKPAKSKSKRRRGGKSKAKVAKPTDVSAETDSQEDVNSEVEAKADPVVAESESEEETSEAEDVAGVTEAEVIEDVEEPASTETDDVEEKPAEAKDEIASESTSAAKSEDLETKEPSNSDEGEADPVDQKDEGDTEKNDDKK